MAQRPAHRRAWALTALLPLLCGIGAPAVAPSWGPNGDGTLTHVEDARWSVFHDLKVSADAARGEYDATFGPALTHMEGREVELSGYMLPLETDASAPHFVLTRRSAGCPFCPPNALNEAVEVRADGPVKYTMAPITIAGRLHLISRSDQGLFFQIDDAGLR